MYTNIQKLFAMANKPNRLILGLMSGTSLDGLDIALCRVAGNGLDTKIDMLHFETISYTESFKKEIKTIFAAKEINLEKLCMLNPWIALKHADMIKKCLQNWQISITDVDLIASHGQTIYHAPAHVHRQSKFGNSTLQIGDGDHLAVATGVITISDFRQKHIAAGGEGAPLAVYGDYFLFSKPGEDRILLNIGGIANFTILPANMKMLEIFSTDTGPGNTMMDALIQKEFPGLFFDADAALASKGTVQEDLLHSLKQHDFFKQPFPKTTGPESFNLNFFSEALNNSGCQHISTADQMATLNKFSADTIAEAIHSITMQDKRYQVYTSGGGIHNPLLISHLKKQLPNCIFNSTSGLQINPDAKEAILFALLANETVCGNVADYQDGHRGMPAVSMGKISFPY